MDAAAVQDIPKDSSASVVAHSATQGASASQVHPKTAGPRCHQGPKTKQRATSQQGDCDMVAGALVGQGVSQEDWEQSLRTDYWVDPLLSREWSVAVPPGRHLPMLEGASVDQWRPQSVVTLDEYLRQLTLLAQVTSQACRYQSQESYFRHSQRLKEAIHDYEAEQGHQYREKPLHLDGEIAGPILATVTHLQQSL